MTFQEARLGRGDLSEYFTQSREGGHFRFENIDLFITNK